MMRHLFRTAFTCFAVAAFTLCALGCPPEKKSGDHEGHDHKEGEHKEGDGHDHSKDKKTPASTSSSKSK